MPAARAACGSRLVAVMPGSEFAEFKTIGDLKQFLQSRQTT